nr:DNA-binding protein [candidate division Zixibacteria bacterium]
MKYRPVEDGYLVLLERGENILESLRGFVKQHHIQAGIISGVGAVTEATLGIYDSEQKEFVTKTFMDELEVGHLSANISYPPDSDEPFIHCHMVVSDRSLSAFTGHLVEATVLLTLEVYIRTLKDKITRTQDPKRNIGHWQL